MRKNRTIGRIVACAWTWVAVTTAAFAQPTSPGEPVGMHEMIARARDAVFPALVNIDVHTVTHWAGQEEKGRATGSGTIIDPSGLVLTNAHVTEDGEKFVCTLSDKTRVHATVVGTDPWTDLALLQLEQPEPSHTYPYAEFGDSNTIQTGDMVMAMGSPFALDRSVTFGIVSNTDRVFTGGPDEELESMHLGWGLQRTGLFTSWIQHDALINPGNSGGPLVNMQGKVIGVNTRGGSGNGFATPSNIAKGVVEQLRKHGRVPRSWIGVSFKHLERTGYDRGVFVDAVDSDGPAYAAGLRAGDLVLEINHLPVKVEFPEQIPKLQSLVASQPVGDEISIKYERNAKTETISVVTRELELDEADKVSLRSWGITASDITDYEAKMMLLPSNEGAYVEGIRSGMPAEIAEPALAWGDIIHGVNGQPVENIRDLVNVYNELQESENRPEYVLVEFTRNGSDMITALKTELPESADPPRDLPKAWLGIDTQPIIPELARHMGDMNAVGFRVTRIYPGTTAADSDLAVGDIIYAINGEQMRPLAIEQGGALGRAIRQLSIDSTATLSLLHEGNAVEIAVKLERNRTTPDEAKREQNRDFGLTVRAVTFFDQIDQRWDEDVKGVLVDAVEDGSWAGAGGIYAGDLITQINDHEVRGLKSFTEAMETISEEQPERVIFRVLRGYRTSFKFVEPEWKPTLTPSAESPAP